MSGVPTPLAEAEAEADGRGLAAVLGPGHPALVPPAEVVVGVLEGEGVGPELTRAAIDVLEAVAVRHGLRTNVLRGPAVTDRTLSPALAGFLGDVFDGGGAVLAGAVGGRFVYDLRRRFDLFCKLVPVRPWEALLAHGPFRPEHLRGVDLVLVRENGAGVYQGVGRRDGARVEHTFAYTAGEVERIVRVGARLAARRRGRLAVVVKDGGLPVLSALWREGAEVACAGLGVAPEFVDVDLFAYRLLSAPTELDVVVAPNLFGDVLADLAALLLGGRGLSFSGNFAASGAAVYQTNHGCAHDLVGRDSANPVGQISALAMLLAESAGAPAAARTVLAAVDEAWRAGWRTADVAGTGDRVVGTRALTERIVGHIQDGREG